MFNPLVEKFNSNYDVILFHEEALKDKINTEIINKSKILKVCATNKKKIINNYDAVLGLPSTLKDINIAIENISAKKIFSNNS